MSREVTGYIKPMILALYAAAARMVASPEQLERLRAELLPELERYRRQEIDEEEVFDKVDEIMGPWDLPEDFSAQLAALGFTERQTGK